MPQTDRPFNSEDVERIRKGTEEARKFVEQHGEAKALMILAARFSTLPQPYIGMTCAALTIELVNATKEPG